MFIDEAYNILDLLSEKSQIDSSDIDMLFNLSKSEYAEIRAYVAELLIMNIGNKSKEILINMCGDSDELVRINACDSLAEFKTIDVYNTLCNVLNKDDSYLVKSYALMSIIDIMDFIKIEKSNLFNLFEYFLKEGENIVIIKATCLKGLYKLGKKKCLQEIFNLLSSEDYHDRFYIINIISDLIDEENYNIIFKNLNKHRNYETTKAVNSIIDKLILKIKQMKHI